MTGRMAGRPGRGYPYHVGMDAQLARSLGMVRRRLRLQAGFDGAARALVEKLEQASALGTGAFALEDGRFVDLAIVESARRTLLLAEK